jgi:prepilin-type N-terminal cleavage/methylation domain-containing protein
MRSQLLRRCRRGFTLVEMLVVIVIIAVLIALIVPIVSSAQRSAKTTASMSNLRQIHTIFMTHLSENNNFFPSATGGTRDDPTPGRFWRRTIWESAHGEFNDATVEQEMQSSGYDDVMWCPLMVGKHGKSQHPGGRGSYAINFFFIDGGWRTGDEFRHLNRQDLKGSVEPLIMTGTVLETNPEFGTWEAVQSSLYPYNTAWMNLNYAYGASGKNALGLFIDGHIEAIPRDKGVDLHPLLSDPTNFE